MYFFGFEIQTLSSLVAGTKKVKAHKKIHTPFFTRSDTNSGFATENELITQEIVGQTQKFTHQAHKKNYCSQKHKSIYVDLFIRGFVGDRCEDQTEIEEKKKKFHMIEIGVCLKL